MVATYPRADSEFYPEPQPRAFYRYEARNGVATNTRRGLDYNGLIAFARTLYDKGAKASLSRPPSDDQEARRVLKAAGFTLSIDTHRQGYERALEDHNRRRTVASLKQRHQIIRDLKLERNPRANRLISLCEDLYVNFMHRDPDLHELTDLVEQMQGLIEGVELLPKMERILSRMDPVHLGELEAAIDSQLEIEESVEKNVRRREGEAPLPAHEVPPPSVLQALKAKGLVRLPSTPPPEPPKPNSKRPRVPPPPPKWEKA